MTGECFGRTTSFKERCKAMEEELESPKRGIFSTLSLFTPMTLQTALESLIFQMDSLMKDKSEMEILKEWECISTQTAKHTLGKYQTANGKDLAFSKLTMSHFGADILITTIKMDQE